MSDQDDQNGQPEVTRRRMLMRLGLAATAIYAAPVMLQLSDARASGFTRGSFTRGSFSGGKRHGRPVKTTAPHGTHRSRRRRHVKSFSS